MPASSRYLEFLLDWMSPLGPLSSRPMFGGFALYCDGTVFALVADEALFLKAGPRNRPLFEARGLEPFQPFPDKSTTMSYFSPPTEFFENQEVMLEWARGAVEAGRQSGRKPKRGKRPRELK